MLTRMTEAEWDIVLTVFRAVRSRRGDKGRDDRKFLQAIHFFTVHNITLCQLSSAPGTRCGSGSGAFLAPACSKRCSMRSPPPATQLT